MAEGGRRCSTGRAAARPVRRRAKGGRELGATWRVVGGTRREVGGLRREAGIWRRTAGDVAQGAPQRALCDGVRNEAGM